VSAQTELHLGADFRPPAEDCRALVERIAASREFQRTSRLRAFLAYVVDRKLAGCPDEITSIVRTQARTLRDRLERYFRGEGAHEPVLLEIPRGGYLPVFLLREVAETPPLQTEPRPLQTDPRPSGSGFQQLRWIGNRANLDALFSGFYDHSVSSYVAAWDVEHSGWMKARAGVYRVHASYNQRPPQFATSADLIAAQYAAYLAYARIQDLKGERGSLSRRMAEEYRAKAEALRARFNSEWWNAAQSRFYSGILPDGSFSTEYVDQSNVYALSLGLTGDGRKSKPRSTRWSAIARTTIPPIPTFRKCSRTTDGTTAPIKAFSKSPSNIAVRAAPPSPIKPVRR
jgi:hypothetical protein